MPAADNAVARDWSTRGCCETAAEISPRLRLYSPMAAMRPQACLGGVTGGLVDGCPPALFEESVAGYSKRSSRARSASLCGDPFAEVAEAAASLMISAIAR